MSEWLTTTEAGERLGGVSRWTVAAWAEQGYFPGAIRARGGKMKIPAEDVEALLRRWRCGGDPVLAVVDLLQRMAPEQRAEVLRRVWGMEVSDE